ncbi:MAG TPA: glycosyltransferase family 39 protein [Pyrinomonadaceae bacterium]|nr:glycosyltransferase family 39 protein [Pyrinomonadaceae bacterium]
MKLSGISADATPNHCRSTEQAAVNTLSARRRLLIIALIFFTALGVRLLNWHVAGNEALAVQSGVAANYKHLAGLIRANGLSSLYDALSPTNNPELLGHPPGYPILLALVYRTATESDAGIQLLQITLDSVSVVIILLLAFELFPAAIGIISGLMAAFAPQFSWNSLTLLPDSLAALPILLAIWLIARISQRGNRDNRWTLLTFFVVGMLIGISSWLRANALLLSPFLVLLLLFIRKREARLGPTLMLVAGALLVIGPLTIRNAVVFGKFIPVSLGAGQTLLEGIADYNSDGSLGLPQTDVELTRAEAETLHRPEYAKSLFAPDGIERDRARLARGVAVIRAHPFWFFGVMVRRAASMLRLERTPLRLQPTNVVSWQQLFQWPLRFVQKLFITAIFLPLTLLGAYLLGYRRQFQTLALLLVVPFYYFCIQSALHTEYRYVLVIHYFLFVLAAVGLYSIGYKITATWEALSANK